jgi:hypothetical protein
VRQSLAIATHVMPLSRHARLVKIRCASVQELENQMQANHETAQSYIELLRRTCPAEHLLEAKVTKKGGAPAQTAKRLVLGRLTQLHDLGPLEKERGDLYSSSVAGRKTFFRFAVTTAPNRLPWFNITEAELETLQARDAILLIVWNPSEASQWCRNLVLFAVPTGDLLQGYRQHASQILQSMLQVAHRKVLTNEALFPTLVKAVRSSVDIQSISEGSTSIDHLKEFRRQFVDHINEFRSIAPPYGEVSGFETARYVAGKIKDRLFALLLGIQPTNGLSAFSVRHNKTNSLLLNGDERLVVELDLGPLERQNLQSSYEQPDKDGSYLTASDGVEVDKDIDASSPELIDRPYDPTKSKIDTRVVTIDLLSKRIAEEEVDLAPPFQRKAGLWSPKQKSQLIESLLIRIPLPAFYFDATNDARWLVVDGLQRLTTFREFLLEELELYGLEYLTAYEGKRFKELPRALQRIILESQVTVHLIQPGTPPEVKFNIFRRINTGGLALTLQEIRHALNQGPVIKLLADLAFSEEFVEATTHSISSDRMADRELVLRFLAFTVTSFREYRVPDMDVFLSVEMGRLNKLQAKYPELRRRFVQAMDAARSILGRQAFRKQYYIHQSRSPVNKALFESWSVVLGSLTQDQIRILIERKQSVVDAAIALNNSDDFHRAISQGTQDVTKVRKRFESVQSLIEQVLNDPVLRTPQL